MSNMSITPLYAAVASLLFVFLSFRVIGVRRSSGVGLGDGGDRRLLRRLRVHGNFAEYAPLAIILMALAELQSTPAVILHLIGATLVAGRLIHAFGVSQEPEQVRLRVTGMVLTFVALFLGAMTNLGLSGVASLLTS